MRRWLANKLAAWSCTLNDWSDRMRPPYVRPPGPETQLERITREQLARYRERWAEEYAFTEGSQWPPPGIGESLRIKLPNDYGSK